MNQVDVLIVGAGPTGLTAATLLARYGIHFRIIDKNAGAAQKSKAIGLHARTLELWEKLGFSKGVMQNGQPLKAFNIITKNALGGKPFMMLERDGKDVSPYPYLVIYEQYKTERMLLNDLEQHLGPKGAYAVERNTEITRLEPKGDHVIVALRHEDGSEETVKATWLIAADGASSFVRKSLSLEFEGATYAEPLFVADVDLEWPLPRDNFYAQIPRQGLLAFIPMRGEGYGDEQYRIISRIPKDLENKEELTGEDIQTILDKHSIVRAKITKTRWVSKYRIHRRMTKQFRVGNIFLAGDAAHIHSPAGGQGMNTGIQDAWNLVWKLALVIRGEADKKLLDSYESERIPVARAILNGSDRGFYFIGSPNPFMHFLRSALLPRIAQLASSNKSVGEKIFRLLSQTWIGYRKSPVVAGDKTNKSVQPGDRAPYAHFNTGESIYSLLSGVGHHLLIFADKQHLEVAGSRIKSLLNQFAFEAQLHLIDTKEHEVCEAYSVKEPSLFLVRPDGHIAWSGSTNELAELEHYLDSFYTRPSAPTEKSTKADTKKVVA